MIRTRVEPRISALALAVVIAVAACSNGSDSDPAETVVSTSSTAPTAPTSDGTLTIGVMLPPAASLLSDPILNGVNAAVAEVNASGGVFGRQVTVESADEGETAADGAAAVRRLLEEDVDAIIGPASSNIAASTLTSIVSDDVLACSPTASALSLDDLPNRELFFRTVPSDSMQAEAISQVADQTGVASVVVAYVDDGFGRPLSDAVSEALARVPIAVTGSIPFASGEADQVAVDLADSVQQVIDSHARVLILLAGSNDGTRFLEALSEAPVPNLFKIIVNDALRSPESVPRLAALHKSTRDKIEGVAPQAESSDPATPFEPPGPFATQAFDCVTLIALAAGIANSDFGDAIALALPSVSTGGQRCHTYADCSQAALEGREINYDGPSGLTEIGPTGDPKNARFDRFTFDDEGHDKIDGTLLVTS